MLVELVDASLIEAGREDPSLVMDELECTTGRGREVGTRKSLRLGRTEDVCELVEDDDC